MIIDLGSGPFPREDADVHVDFVQYPHVEVIHNLLDFPYPFEDACASKIYLWEVLEHITCFQIKDVLLECYEILQPGGVLDITCPDMKWIVDRIYLGDWKEKAEGVEWMNRAPTDFLNAMRCIFGGSYDDNEWPKSEMRHVAGYDEATLIALLKEVAPWADVQRVLDPRGDSLLHVEAIK
jgi:predicted SAM-dependent methyltransferase